MLLAWLLSQLLLFYVIGVAVSVAVVAVAVAVAFVVVAVLVPVKIVPKRGSKNGDGIVIVRLRQDVGSIELLFVI